MIVVTSRDPVAILLLYRCLRHLWHYVEIDELSSSAILIVEISIKENLSVFIVSSTSEKIRKFKIDNLKTITIIQNPLKCNDQDLLKNEINVIKAWQIFKKSFSSCESKILNDLFIKLWIIILIINQNVINYARQFKKTLQDIQQMIVEMFINDNILILYFHLDFDAKYEQYWKHYVQTHDIVFIEFNFEREINYAINKFLNICVNRFVLVEFVVIMIVIVFISALFVKNLILIQMKKCTHCQRYYHVKSECWDKHFHLKRNHQNRKNQSNEDDRDNKRRRKNDKNNDNDNNNNNDNRNDDDENVEKFHKLYIVMIFETLSTINVMFAQIIFWILNNACSQHNIRKKSTFISYTIYNKSISINDLERSTYVMKQKTIRVICNIDNKRTNIFFSTLFMFRSAF